MTAVEGLLGSLDQLHGALIIRPLRQRRAHGLLLRDPAERGKRRGVGQIQSLRGWESDDAPESQFILVELILLRHEKLLFGFELHLGAQHVDAGSNAGNYSNAFHDAGAIGRFLMVGFTYTL